MKSSCTHLAPLMSGIKSSAFDLFSLSLSETFNLSPPGRDWYIKVQILPWRQLPLTTWPGRSSHLHLLSLQLLLLLFHLIKYQLLRLFTPSKPNSTTSSSSSFCYSASLCSSSIPSSPTCSGCWPDHLSPFWAQPPPPPHLLPLLHLLLFWKNNRGKTILGIEFVRGSNSNFCFIFKTKHNFAHNKHW